MSDAKAWNDALQAALELTGYHELDEVYDNEHITDLPSTKTTIQGKSIINRYKGPDLDRLYDVLDKGMESLNWQPIETK
jgi:RNAse (barnase) inhibitor barstar